MMAAQQQDQMADIFLEIQEALFPPYTPGSTTDQVLKTHERLKDYLYRIDNAKIGRDIPLDLKDDFLSELIRLLNEACSFTHRKQISKMILETVSGFNKNLAYLAVGRLPITVSEWTHEIVVPKLTDYREIAQKHEKILTFDVEATITKLLDRLYQQQHRISHLDHLMLNFPSILIAKTEFQDALLQGSESPTNEKLYIGLIAASTFGSQYLWAEIARKFLKAGGDPQWLEEGIECNHIPPYIKKLSEVSWIMAFQFRKICSEDYFYNTLASSSVSDAIFIEGLYILSYYQSLACLCLVCGLQPENNELISRFIPVQKSLKPTPESFDAMLHKQHKEQTEQQQKAIDFVSEFLVNETDSRYQTQESQSGEQKRQQLKNSPTFNKLYVRNNKFHWESSDQDEDNNQPRSQQAIGEEQDNFTHKNTLKQLAKQSEQYQKLKNMKSLEKLRAIHSKFIYLKQLEQLSELSMTGVNTNDFNWKPRISPKLFRKNTTNNISIDQRQLERKFSIQLSNPQQSPPRSENTEHGRCRTNSIKSGKILDEEITYASDWNFQQNALQDIHNLISAKLAIKLKVLIENLREQQLTQHQLKVASYLPRSPKATHSRNMQIYYEMINKYLHECVDYPTIIGKSLNTSQKNFIKLVTKSPFLFNAESFAKMRRQLKLDKSEILKLVFEIVSYKMELNISIVTAMYSKFRNANQQ